MSMRSDGSRFARRHCVATHHSARYVERMGHSRAPARTLASVTLALGCATPGPDRWTETVELPSESAPPEIVVENSQARIHCPVERALEFADDPVPMIPQQRELSMKRPEKWAKSWRERASRLRRSSNASSPQRRRPDEIKDFLHAGICRVIDRRKNEPQKAILVVVSHDPEYYAGGGRREFRFMDGTTFFGVIDWMP